MHQHPYFELLLHDSDELSELIGKKVVDRVTLHEWPLSCVQRITFADGQTCIYKVQSQPTVEPDFYHRARSPLLVNARFLAVPNQPEALLIEDIDAVHCPDLSLPLSKLLDFVDRILDQIQAIEGDLPAYLDIRTKEKWLTYLQTIGNDLLVLVETGKFNQVTPAKIDTFIRFGQSAGVLSAFYGMIGYAHSDLYAENIFILEEGVKIIDWQRPIWGPVELDRITLLESLNLDPAKYVQSRVLFLHSLLLIGWLTQAARYWYPAGTSYDNQIAQYISELE
jgi:hypothetical protein